MKQLYTLKMWAFVIMAVGLLSTSVGAYGAGEALMRARVVAVNPGEPAVGSFGEMERQVVTATVQGGPAAGETVTFYNLITGHPYYDLPVQPGDRVLIQQDTTDGVDQYHLVDYARDRSLLWITWLFVVSIVLVGGRKGIKALLSLMIMGVLVVYVLLPLVLSGYHPLMVTVLVSSLVTIVFVPFISGCNSKTVATIAGTVGGMCMAGLLAYAVGRASHLTGLSSSDAQMLQFMEGNLNAQGLLFAGIMIGALGAILDVAMSVASAMEQIREADPYITLGTMVARGLSVGRDLLGTMSNTLILAYLGTSMPLLLLFQASDTSLLTVVNLDMVATEIIRAMAGSIGLALAVPLTAIVAGYLYVKQAPSTTL